MKKGIVAFVLLGIPFAVTSALAAIAGLIVSPLYGRDEYAKNLMRAADKHAAAFLGWSGRYTVSAECGSRDCRFCRWLCRLLDVFQKGHCAGAAEREGTKPK